MDTYWFYNEGGELNLSNTDNNNNSGNTTKQKADPRKKNRFSVPNTVAEKLASGSSSSSGGSLRIHSKQSF